ASPPPSPDHKPFREAVAVDREEQPCRSTMTIHRACSTLVTAGSAPTRRAWWTTTTAYRTRKPTSARPGSGPGRPTGTPSGRCDPPPSGSCWPRPPSSRDEPASRGCNPPEVDIGPGCPPGGRQASVGWGPTAGGAPL